MRATRDSAAYKYEEDAQREEKYQERKSPEKRNRAKPVIGPGLVVGAVIVVIAAAYILFCNMELTQLTLEINEKNDELNNLVAENISLSSKQAYDMDLDEVDEYAVENLGMVKMDPGQIEYVELVGEDKITVSNPELTPERMLEILGELFFKIVEYIR